VFTLFLRFCRDVRGIAPEKLRLEQIDVSLVEAFLGDLQTGRKSSPRTRIHAGEPLFFNNLPRFKGIFCTNGGH
jgi:hypothetical protein